LAVTGQLTPEESHVGHNLIGKLSEYQWSKCFDPGNAQLIGPADRESEFVSDNPSG